MSLLGVIKGDVRYDALASMMNVVLSKKLEDFIGIDALLLPLGGIDEYYNIKQSNLNILDIISQNTIDIIFTGTANEKLTKLCEVKKIQLVELLKESDFVIDNAKLTALGIIDYLQRQNVSVTDQRIFLMGYGYINAILAKLLKASGATFAVYTEQPMEAKFAKIEGFSVVDIPEVSNYDIVVNTIPANFKGEYISFIDKKIIDVASAPYGFDIEEIRKYGIRYEIYSAIPSKFAPLSAAKIIKRIIEKY